MMTSHKITLRFDPVFCILLAVLFLTVPARLLFGWMLAVVVHELGHFLALLLCRVNVYSILFGVAGASMQTRTLSDTETLICAAAGPAAGFLLLLGAKWHPVASVCAAIHGIYNLLPFPGYDGDRILGALCGKLFSENASAVHSGVRVTILLTAFSALLHLLFG